MEGENGNRTDQGTDGGQGSGGSAGSDTLQLTAQDLQSRIDRAVQQAISTNQKNHEKALSDKEGELQKLRDEIAGAGKTQGELLEQLKQQLQAEREGKGTLEKQLQEIQGTFDTMLQTRLEAMGERAKATFEKVCPDELKGRKRLEFFERLQAEGVFKEESQPKGAAPPARVKSPDEGDDPTDFGSQMAKKLSGSLAEASQGAKDPWAS